jgi:hypothetical protein
VCLGGDLKIRGKFVGMRKPGTALHVPWDVEPRRFPIGALHKKEFAVVNGTIKSLEDKTRKIVVVPPKK